MKEWRKNRDKFKNNYPMPDAAGLQGREKYFCLFKIYS
jgi:hypothetical protein